jgi:hypothetical protein
VWGLEKPKQQQGVPCKAGHFPGLQQDSGLKGQWLGTTQEKLSNAKSVRHFFQNGILGASYKQLLEF